MIRNKRKTIKKAIDEFKGALRLLRKEPSDKKNDAFGKAYEALDDEVITAIMIVRVASKQGTTTVSLDKLIAIAKSIMTEEYIQGGNNNPSKEVEEEEEEPDKNSGDEPPSRSDDEEIEGEKTKESDRVKGKKKKKVDEDKAVEDDDGDGDGDDDDDDDDSDDGDDDDDDDKSLMSSVQTVIES